MDISGKTKLYVKIYGQRKREEKGQLETKSDTDYYEDPKNIWTRKFATVQDASKVINITVIADPDSSIMIISEERADKSQDDMD